MCRETTASSSSSSSSSFPPRVSSGEKERRKKKIEKTPPNLAKFQTVHKRAVERGQQAREASVAAHALDDAGLDGRGRVLEVQNVGGAHVEAAAGLPGGAGGEDARDARLVEDVGAGGAAGRGPDERVEARLQAAPQVADGAAGEPAARHTRRERGERLVRVHDGDELVRRAERLARAVQDHGGRLRHDAEERRLAAADVDSGASRDGRAAADRLADWEGDRQAC
ncbi:hypothetical protein F4809DRAFT_352362 [Biscogniauxia mediterranea]|nr:hypothetical protein F4809DRAFT_352362 [Biscogniauxia mediterranea]